MPSIDMVNQYNTAVTDLNAALDALGGVTGEEERTAAQTRFNEASAEVQRCQANIDNGEIAKRYKPIPVEDPNKLNMDGNEVRNYSIVRAINAQMRALSGERDAWKGAELEREASEAISKKLGRSAKGFFVPSDVQSQKRDFTGMTAGVAADGGNLVATNLLASSMIELLRNKMVVKQAGAMVLSGLIGNVSIPAQTGASSYYWVGENAAPSGSKAAVSQISLSPHTGGAFTDIDRRLLEQSSIDVESFVRSDIVNVCALGLDLAALYGTGADNQPKGLAKITGIGAVSTNGFEDATVTGAVPTWAEIVALETAVSAANADSGNLAYITNAKVRGLLKSTPKVSGFPKYIWDVDGNDTPLNGYNAYVTNQIPSNLGFSTKESGIFFGNWNDLIISQWGTLDILVDPFTFSTTGAVRIVALQDTDIAVRHAASFAYCADALTA